MVFLTFAMMIWLCYSYHTNKTHKKTQIVELERLGGDRNAAAGVNNVGDRFETELKTIEDTNV